ncbi:hypothetical protein [uncultured Eubacterium sp.]|uniref:hypothetical protein n=1 Tax=uncultured Eubacterium sp. TaxID=165185 RepID=UPI0025E99EF8|nr:hypothetical protein [uncultured Eubacterium sp.]
MALEAGAIALELKLDSGKLFAGINSSCNKVKAKFEQSFSAAGQAAEKATDSAVKAVKTGNEKIDKILADTEKSAKAKAASIAYIYKTEGYSQSDAFKKAWSHIERSSSSGADNVKKSIRKISDQSKKTSQGLKNDLSGAFSNTLKGLAGKLAGAFAIKSLVQFGKKCIDLGSDLAEVQNVVDVTFPRMTKTIDTFATSAAAKFGLSETMAKKFTGTFGSMVEAFGFSEKQAADMATTLTGLAGDVASFYNISQDEAYTKLKSVFSGETETLKDLGIVMTQSALDAYALANGYGKVTSKMTEAEKVSLRYAFVQSQLTNAAGDFARTSDSWANQVRLLSLQFDSLRASIGQGLINVFTPVIKWLNVLMAKLAQAAKAFASFTSLFTKKKSSGAGAAASAVASNISKAATSASNLGTSAGKSSSGLSKAAKAAKKLKRELAGFDQITKLGDEDSDTDTGSSGDTGGGSGGIGGGVGDTGLESGLPGADEASKDTIKLKVNFDNLKKSVDNLKQSFGKFADVVKGGLKWAWDNVLKPLGKWTIEKLAPKLIDVLSAAFDVLTAALKALQPYAKWIWDHFLKKIAKFAGDAIIKFLEAFAKALEKVAGWIEKHPKAFDTIVTGILGIMAAIKVGKKVSDFAKHLNTFIDVFKKVKGAKDVAELSKGIGGFGTKLLKSKGTLKDFGGWFKNAMSGFKLHKKGIISFKTLFSGLFPNISKTLGSIGGVFKKFGGKVGTFGKTIVKAFLKAGKAIGGLIAANPVLFAVIAAIAAAIAIGILLYKNWDKIKKKLQPLLDAFKKFGKAIKDAFKGIPDFFKKIFGKAKENIKKKFDKIGDYFKKRYEDTKKAFKEIKVKVSAWFTDKKQKLKDKWTKLTSDIKEKTAEMKAAIKQKWSDLKQKWTAIVSNIKEKTAEMKAAIKQKWADLSSKWHAIIDNIKEKTAEMKAQIKQRWANLSESWHGIVDNIKEKTAEMKAKVASRWNDLKGQWNSLLSNFKGKTCDIALKFSAAAKDLKDWINTNVIDRVNSKFKKVPILKNHLIPHLAQGGYVKANTPQLALIGDNRHQGEVVAPENKMIEMARKAAELSGGGGADAEIVSLLRQILALLKSLDLVATIDGNSLKQLIVKLINDHTRATGMCEIEF